MLLIVTILIIIAIYYDKFITAISLSVLGGIYYCVEDENVVEGSGQLDNRFSEHYEAHSEYGKMLSFEWMQLQNTNSLLNALYKNRPAAAKMKEELYCYEIKNIVERLLMTAAQNTESPEWPNLHKIAILDSAAINQSGKELYSKKIVKSEKEGAIWIKQYMNTAKQPLRLLKFTLSCRAGEILLTCENQQKRLTITRRINILLDRAAAANSPPLASVMRAFLRYQALAAGGQHWGLPQNHHDKQYSLLNVRNEGFSSPFNSRIIVAEANAMMTNSNTGNVNFYSLFKDTDKVFGSNGPFWNAKITEAKGNWNVNPPYVESVIARVRHKVITELHTAMSNKQQIIICCLLPGWSDNVDIMALRNSEMCYYFHDLAPGKHFIETPEGKTQICTFRNYFLILASYPVPKYLLSHFQMS